MNYYYLYNTETLWGHNKFYMRVSNKNNETEKQQQQKLHLQLMRAE